MSRRRNLNRRGKHTKYQPLWPGAIPVATFGTVDGLRALLRTGSVKMRTAYVQPAEVPFSADTVRASVEKIRTDHYDPEIRAARWEAWQKEEDALQREWNEWARDAWIARYGDTPLTPSTAFAALQDLYDQRHAIEGEQQ